MKNKVIKYGIITIVAIIVLAVAYKLFFGGSSTPAPSLKTTAGVGVNTPRTSTTTNASVSNASVGQDFLSLLLNVESIKLDDSIFSSKEFGLLQDFNRPIPPDNNPGRPNPFAPIGLDGQVISTQVSTSNPSSINATTSTLNGTLTASGPDITRWFQYGTTQNLGQMTTPKIQLNPGAFAEPITGLTPNTTYYVKAGASIGGVPVLGNIVTWKTAQGVTKTGTGK